LRSGKCSSDLTSSRGCLHCHSSAPLLPHSSSCFMSATTTSHMRRGLNRHTLASVYSEHNWCMAWLWGRRGRCAHDECLVNVLQKTNGSQMGSSFSSPADASGVSTRSWEMCHCAMPHRSHHPSPSPQARSKLQCFPNALCRWSLVL
jgi:hypothetical protein